MSDTQGMVVGAKSGPGDCSCAQVPWPAHCKPVCFACAAGVSLPAQFHLKGVCSVLGDCTVSGAFCLQKHTATPNLNTDVMAGGRGSTQNVLFHVTGAGS